MNPPTINSRIANTQMTAWTDQELIGRVRKRDGQALEVLYERYAGKALGLAYKILRERELAEEVMVDAFWRVWQCADQYQVARGSFSGWFARIVHNLAIDQVRRRNTRPLTHSNMEALITYEDGRAEDLFDQIVHRLTADRVHAALQKLPVSQRQVIELALFEGLSRREIARRLKKPLGTIHTRTRLGYEKLRVILTDSGMASEN